jgi:hypothetical protein
MKPVKQSCNQEGALGTIKVGPGKIADSWPSSLLLPHTFEAAAILI